MLGECLGHRQAKFYAPSRRQRRVERIHVQHMNEAIADAERAVGKLTLARTPHESVYVLQSFQSLLNFSRIQTCHCCGYRGLEFVSLNRRRREKPPIILPGLVDLALNHP